MKPKNIIIKSVLVLFFLNFSACNKSDDEVIDTIVDNNDDIEITPSYTIEQTLSDGAQRNTIAFDALGFMIGNLGAQSFLPPGKLADYCGFQYLRDNDPTNLGHNTSFVTIIAHNILHILNDTQINMFVNAAYDQIDMINQYAYNRYPLMKAFRRLMDGDIPEGTSGLDLEAVKEFSASLYELDGQISYGRSELFGQIISSLSTYQLNALDELVAHKGIGYWGNTLSDPLSALQLEKDVNVAVMTYASEIYSWYAGSVTADVYFCPERQGTYFGSFYLKDWPAMGNPDYTINEQLTATAGQEFLNLLNSSQYDLINGLVETQKTDLYDLVGKREDISTELRKFLSNETANQNYVLSLSEEYGRLDGEIVYHYATNFAAVYQSLSDDQKNQLKNMASSLGYIEPTGGFLYSDPIAMPVIIDTDFLFE